MCCGGRLSVHCSEDCWGRECAPLTSPSGAQTAATGPQSPAVSRKAPFQSGFCADSQQQPQQQPPLSPVSVPRGVRRCSARPAALRQCGRLCAGRAGLSVARGEPVLRPASRVGCIGVGWPLAMLDVCGGCLRHAAEARASVARQLYYVGTGVSHAACQNALAETQQTVPFGPLIANT